MYEAYKLEHLRALFCMLLLEPVRPSWKNMPMIAIMFEFEFEFEFVAWACYR